MLSEDADKMIQEWLEEHAVQVDEETWECRRCGDTIWASGERVSIHEMYTVFNQHAGGGETRVIAIPYCRKCDGKPTMKIGCLDY